MKQDPNPATETDALREQAEARLQEQRPAARRPLTEAESHRLIHELEVHQVELEMQNHALLELHEQLEQNLEKYTDLYDFAPVGYLTVADDGTIREVNLAGAALLGLERARLINRRFGLFVAAETRPTFNAFLERVLVGTAREHCEITLAHDDAPPRHLHLEGVAVIAGADRWCHLVAMDITERKQVEAALRDREQSFQRLADELREERDRFAKIVATVPGGIFSFRLRPDGSDCCPYASPTFKDLYGLPPEDLAESAAPLWAIIHPDDLDQVRASVAASARTLTPWRDEFRWWRPTGEEIWVEGHSMPVREPDGSILWHGFLQDITERKRAEAALRAALAEKEALLREVHHRVKNNLAAIIGLLELQREGITERPLNCRLLSCQLEELSNRIRSMALVHEMLYQSDNLHRIDFHEYLQTLVAHLRHAFDPEGAIRIEVAAPGVFMDLDTAIPCGLIVNELVINALKYAFPGHRPGLGGSACEISVTAAWDGAAYTLTVADNGVGLPAGLDWATTRTLGLRLVRMLGQHQLGGQLELHGAHGTCFSLQFGSKIR